MAAALAALPDDALVVIDGLALGGLPAVVATEAQRLRLIALVHHPLCDETGLSEPARQALFERERAALAVCRGVVVTSGFTARRLTDFDVAARRIHVVPPGVTAAPQGPQRDDSSAGALLCVATITPRKGQDLLVQALAGLRDLPWQCRLVGSVERDPAYAAQVRSAIAGNALGERIELVGEIDPGALRALYRDAGLFVLPSHYEGFGMVFIEAINHGLPVVGTTGGALPDTIPADAGLLVPPGDATALGHALRDWLTDEALRSRLRGAARRRSRELPTWDDTVASFAEALGELAA
nr:glycosyltransferase family 4 protein [Natronocella acetinitrilica]